MEQVETKVDVLASRSVGRNEASTDTSEHPVDVLAVMNRLIRTSEADRRQFNLAQFHELDCQSRDEEFEARAAIAELIEAGSAILSHNPAHCDTDEEKRLRTALARVSGGGK